MYGAGSTTRFGSGTATFDVTDVNDLDTLDEVLNLAVEVIDEFGAHSVGATRIERMARWLIANIGGEPYVHVHSGTLSRYTVGVDPGKEDLVDIWRVGGKIGVQVCGFKPTASLQPEQASAVAIALLRAVERTSSLE